MYTSTLFTLLTSLTSLTFALPSPEAPSTANPKSCKKLTVPITVTSPSTHHPLHLPIAATFCKPATTNPSRASTLQVLVHGSSYNQTWWSGLRDPTARDVPRYSWIDYATSQGYPVLQFDRPCSGMSPYLNGSSECVLTLNADVAHGIIAAARAGTLPGITTKFAKIVYAGHSLGSFVGNNLSLRYPGDVDALVLTGYSPGVVNGLGAGENAGAKVAVDYDPQKYGHLKDSGYYVLTNRTGFQTAYYNGNFAEAIVDYDYSHHGLVAAGDIGVFNGTGLATVKAFKGSVFVLNGVLDHIMCENSNDAGAAGKDGDCTKYSKAVKAFYPNAKKFALHNTPATGHTLNTHLSAKQSFKAAHDFLESAGF